MQNSILVLNSGSSSLKFALYTANNRMFIANGQIENLDHNPHFYLKEADGTVLHEENLRSALNLEEALEQALEKVLQTLANLLATYKIVAIGHRIVHGGDTYFKPTLISKKIIRDLECFIPLAPLHQPYNLSAVKLLRKKYPNVLQIACFDTGFHATEEPIVQAYALPKDISTLPIKRYGFHGLSYEYIAEVLPKYLGNSLANQRIIIAHLGHGASLCAIKHRKSIATTMGFSALEGLPMGTRSGSLDPGILLYLLTVEKMSVEQLTELLYNRSGLLGISGISGDVRVLLKSDAPQAKEALKFFVYRVHREIGSLVAALGGLDALVFTAGIGEHAPEIRAGVCQLAAWLGIKIKVAANRGNACCISKADSAVSVWVIPTNEELIIARQTWEIFKERKD